MKDKRARSPGIDRIKGYLKLKSREKARYFHKARLSGDCACTGRKFARDPRYFQFCSTGSFA